MGGIDHCNTAKSTAVTPQRSRGRPTSAASKLNTTTRPREARNASGDYLKLASTAPISGGSAAARSRLSTARPKSSVNSRPSSSPFRRSNNRSTGDGSSPKKNNDKEGWGRWHACEEMQWHGNSKQSKQSKMRKNNRRYQRPNTSQSNGSATKFDSRLDLTRGTASSSRRCFESVGKGGSAAAVSRTTCSCVSHRCSACNGGQRSRPFSADMTLRPKTASLVPTVWMPVEHSGRKCNSVNR
jgi:hypothetical protein